MTQDNDQQGFLATNDKPTRPNVALDPVTQTAVFRNAGERGRYLQDLLQQGVLPKHLDTVAKVENAYSLLTQMRLPWQSFLNKTYYVGAQLTVMGEALLAACRATGLLEYCTVEWVNEVNETMSDKNLVGFKVAGCVCRAKRKDETKEVLFGFTMAEAQEAGLTARNQNYKKFTKDMLMWRAIGRTLKFCFADSVGGIAVQGVDDLAPMLDDDGKAVTTRDGHVVYAKRQGAARSRLEARFGGGDGDATV